jgi:hypothetical protein
MPPFNNPEVLVPSLLIPIVVIFAAKAFQKFRNAHKAKQAQGTKSTS